MKKSRRAYYLPVIHTVYLQELCALSAYKTHETVFRLFGLPLGKYARRKQKSGKGKQYSTTGPHHGYSSVLILSIHSSWVNGQSLKIGSMTMYVSEIFFFMNSSMAFIALSFWACSDSMV